MTLKSYITALALTMAAPVAVMAQGVDTTPAGYSLLWSDEFDGTELNERIWNVEVNGNGGGNSELQYYRRENVSVEDGNLVLTARRENYQGRSFTSGRVTTQNKAAFKHGIIQARIKFPRVTDGLWPAYWMMGNDMSKYGWPRCGEIDIVELGHFNGINAGTQDRYFGGTLHYGPDATNENHQQYSEDYTAPESNPITGDYHIITMEWDNDNLYMYYDLQGYKAAQKRQARYFTKNITYSDEELAPGHYFQKPFFFLFNLAVGGSFPSIYDPALITALPEAGSEAKMYVDWVRVYQADDDADAQYTYIDENGDKQTNIEEEPEPEPEPDTKTELSSFATKALDANGVSTFDFKDVSDAVLISTSEGVKGNLLSAGANVTDYNVNNTTRNLYIWENTYVAADRSGETNSFGWGEGYSKFTVGSVGWSGLGFNIKGEDLSMVDDTYWLHFAMRGTDQALHTSHTVTIAKAQFIVGKSDGKLASIGDFKRDGEWYYFDIPVKALKQFATPVLGDTPAAFDDNIVAFMSGGITDAELCYDNIFFYKSKTKEIPAYTDTSADLGKYGYKSLDADGKPMFSFEGVTDVVPLVLSGDTWEALTAGGTYGEGSLVKAEYDNSEQGNRGNFFVWNGINVASVKDVPNSMGRVPYDGVLTYSSTLAPGWNGAGWASIEGSGRTPQPLNLSTIDDSYILHLSLRSDAAVAHTPVLVRLGSEGTDAALVFGNYCNRPVFADFNRDGEWYSFDIPVAELKRHGLLWSAAAKPENGSIDSFTGYSLCFNTAATYYNGCSFSIDNVFFYKKAGETSEVSELGDYTTKSLDEQNESYFSFAGKDFVNISANGDVTEKMKVEGEESIVLDVRNGVNGAQFYNWTGNSYTEGSQSGSVPNSFGGNEGWMDFVTNGGWTGAGLLRDVSGQGVDLTVLESGNWHLHFAMRGTDNCNHQIGFAEAKFTIGSAPFGEGVPVLGNYKRDGEWYSYDIPYSVLKTLVSDMYPASNGGQSNYRSNLLWFMSGGGQGDEIQLDNVFLWRDKSSVDTGIALPEAPRADAAATVIYDISGRRQPNMAKPGLYIVRTAGHVKKVIVK